MNFRGRLTISGRSAVAATVINVLIPPKPNCFSLITKLRYINTGTTQGHTLTVLKPVGVTTLSATATAAQKTIVVSTDPAGTYYGPDGQTSRVAAVVTSAGDYLAFGPLPDGTFYLDTSNSTVIANVITMATNIPTQGIPSGTKVWNLKVTGQTDPFTAQVFNTVSCPAGAAGGQTVAASNFAIGGITDLGDGINGIESSNRMGEPMLIQSNNLSVLGIVDLVTVVYSKYGG